MIVSHGQTKQVVLGGDSGELSAGALDNLGDPICVAQMLLYLKPKK